MGKHTVYRIFVLIFGLLFYHSTLAAAPSLTFDIQGIQGDVKTNVETRLNLLKSNYSIPLSDQAIQALFDEGPANIKEAMKPYGYFQPVITSQLEHRNNRWIAHYAVAPGTLLPVTALTITVEGPGNDNRRLKKAMTDLPLKLNQPLTTDNYQKTKRTLLLTLQQQGFIKASFTQDNILIDLNHHQSTVNLTLQTGERYYVGKITFHNSTYSDKFLRSFLTFKEGDAFSTEKLIALQEALSQTSFFSSAVITPHIDSAIDNKVPIDIFLTPSKSRQYLAGIGYGTYTQARMVMSATFRHLNSEGHHFSTMLTLSEVQSGLIAQYYIPGKQPLYDEYSLGGQAQRQRPNQDGFSDYQNIFTAYSHTRNNFQQRYQLTYQQERYQITGDDPTQRSYLLMPSALFSYNAADAIINPSRGYSLDLQLKGADNNVISSTTFFQTQLSGKYLYPFTYNNRLLLRSTVGATAVNDLETLPLSLRFYAGGINSVRGYNYQDIGPGKFLKLMSAEFQRRIVGDWFAIAFFDTGTASDNFNHSLARGTGPGIMWQSPIGSLELTAAKALTKEGQPWRFDFTIGLTL